MQAYTQLENKAYQSDEARKKIPVPKNPFSVIRRALTSMATFYDDRRVREMGNPYIWTE